MFPLFMTALLFHTILIFLIIIIAPLFLMNFIIIAEIENCFQLKTGSKLSDPLVSYASELIDSSLMPRDVILTEWKKVELSCGGS